MKQSLLATTLAVGLTLSLVADQSIKFSNAAADVGPGKLVTFAPSFGGLGHGGVVNGPLPFPQSSYVAQLFWIKPDGGQQAIGATANFRINTTASPGTWVGATRTLVGVAQGTPLTLMVKAWDAAFLTMEAAMAAGKPGGQSAPFAFQDAMSSPAAPSDTLMTNFQGFSIVQVPEPATVALGGLGFAAALWLSRRPGRRTR